MLHILWRLGECVCLSVCLKSSELTTDSMGNKEWIAIITILFLKKIYGIIRLGLASKYGDSGEDFLFL